MDYSKDLINHVLKSIVENSEHVVIFALDCDYRYVVYNHNHFNTMKHIWGCEISAGHSMLCYISDPVDRQKAKENFDRTLAGESFTLVEEYGDTLYDRRVYNIVYNPIFNDRNKVIGISVILHDITEETNAKLALKESNAAKNKFFNIIAHDLRNPLSAILNFSKILAEKYEQNNVDEMEKFIQQILITSKHTYLLLENLLEWSMTQTDRITYSPDNYPLEELFARAVSQARSSADKKEINLSFDLKENISINADKNMTDTILRNLISNAIKFTNRNGKIIVSATKHKNEVTISIKDNGVGMDNETKENLFDLGNDIKHLGTEREKGTGIGLLLCKEFVDKHNGKIWVESEEGKGSDFKFTLPVSS